MQPDTILPRPGPGVTTMTAGLPEVLAYPSAMKTRLASWRAVIVSMFW